jgi:hypothetical protein
MLAIPHVEILKEMCKLEKLMKISNTFGQRGFYSFCAPADLGWVDQGQITAQFANQSHLWHPPFPI